MVGKSTTYTFMSRPDKVPLQIGAFYVDPSVDEVSRNGAITKLERRTMQVLQYLAARSGEVVSVDDLLTGVWADVVVTPDSVYQTISALRRALGDDPKAPQYIVSVPRRGYRMVAPVTTWRPPAAPAVAPASDANSAPPPASIAVLPFVDMSAGKDHEYFADGISEELIHLLAQVRDLRVPARTSSFYFKGKSENVAEIAKKLRVAHVLEGSVRTSDRRIRVTAQLILADSGYHLWSKSYDRDMGDIFKVQDEIAAAVVDAMKVRLLPTQQAVHSRRTANTDAYKEFLLGRRLFLRGHADDFRRGVDVYRKAIALDPGFAAAYAGLALAEAYLADAVGDMAARKRAEKAADRAVELAPELVDGYAARGTVRFVFGWDWRGAQQDLARALALEPADSWAQRQHGKLCRSLGRMHDAIAAGSKAADLDPLSNFVWEGLGNTYAASGDLTAARIAYSNALELEPDSFYATDGLGIVELIEGRAAKALALFGKVDVERSFKLPGTAMAEHTLGHAKDSRRALDEAIASQAQTGAYDIAAACAWRGEHDQSFQWLERAYKQRERGLSEVKIDPLLAGLRGHPRYKALQKKLNLPE